MTRRFKLTVEYDGTDFVGWQRQDNGPSVQGALEQAAHEFSGESVMVQGAGRTDSGVHALGQVAHLDLEREITAAKLRDALNAHLRPLPVAVLEVEAVTADFHARFSAKQRRYLYRIVNRRAPLALDARRAWFVPQKLDLASMRAGASHLTGQHDFSAFRAAECQAESALKTLDSLTLQRQGTEIRVECAARSFLHHQVRNLVGTLALVGRGKRPAEWIKEVLGSCDRNRAGPTAPACGLYLTQVLYEEDRVC